MSALLLLLNTWFRTLWLLGAAAGAWFLLSILVGTAYPAFVQAVQVEPNELEVERPYIRNHLEATRAAFDLDTIETRQFTGEQDLSREVFEEDEATISNLRLWDYRPLLTTFGQQHILRRYYTFTDVDIDRYQVKVDKASGIVNDPNDWSDDPRYIIDLLKRIVTVSLETMKIVDSLPELDILE